MEIVYIVESGEYEQRFVQGIFSSVENAIASIKRPYTAPYIVKWDDPRHDGEGVITLVGNFSRVEGYCGDGPAEWTITPITVDTD